MHCLVDFGCCKVKQATEWFLEFSVLVNWYWTGTVLADVGGWLHRECNGTGQKSKAVEVSVRQEVYSQQMRALEISWCAMAGGSCLVRIRAGIFSCLLPVSPGLSCCRRTMLPTTVLCFWKVNTVGERGACVLHFSKLAAGKYWNFNGTVLCTVAWGLRASNAGHLQLLLISTRTVCTLHFWRPRDP